MARHGNQPFFNSIETLSERLTYLREVGATHILLDPSVHKLLAPILAQWPETFILLFDADGWSIFAIAQ